MTPAEKARKTRAENKAFEAHRAAVLAYAGSHGLKARGVRFSLGRDAIPCHACGVPVREHDVFRDNDRDVLICRACVDGEATR